VLITTSTQMGLAPTDINWRLYVTRNSGGKSKLMIWGLNFNDDRRPP